MNLKAPRAIGIARVSVEGDREETRLHSYKTQADAIGTNCEEQGYTLLRVGKERAISGGANLDTRRELLKAIEAVESGDAEVIIAAYFDRFFRSLALQAEVIARVEAAGGILLALDHGRLTNGTAAERLHANVIGAISQFYREQTAEKSRAGQQEAINLGRVPWSRTQLGYTRTEDSRYAVNKREAKLVEEVFRRRLAGESHQTIRTYLAGHGVERTARGVQQMLSSRVYLGEIHFGNYAPNLSAHPPIIDRTTFDAVQRKIVPRGKQAKTERLLSRLRVVRCGTCGGAMGTMRMPKQGDYAIYRCGSWNTCERHVTIAAEIIESWVWDHVKERLSDDEGRSSSHETALRLADARDEAQARLDHAMQSFVASGVSGEPTAVLTLTELREARDAAQAELDALPPTAGLDKIVRVDDSLPLDVRRSLIGTTVRAVTVAPAAPSVRGDARLAIEFREFRGD